jgi:hypothetical protein
LKDAELLDDNNWKSEQLPLQMHIALQSVVHHYANAWAGLPCLGVDVWVNHLHVMATPGWAP